MSHRETEEGRYEKYVKRIKDGCWDWTGQLNYKGYGSFYANGKTTGAHRYSYEKYKGEIPEGLQIDHLCRNRKCVNPDHLEAVTSKENNMRGIGLAAKNARKTKCLNGHHLQGENLRPRPDGSRVCVQCTRKNNSECQKRRVIKRREAHLSTLTEKGT